MPKFGAFAVSNHFWFRSVNDSCTVQTVPRISPYGTQSSGGRDSFRWEKSNAHAAITESLQLLAGVGTL